MQIRTAREGVVTVSRHGLSPMNYDTQVYSLKI